MRYFNTTDPNGSPVVVAETDDGHFLSFTENPENADWRAYEEWLAEGNTPEPWPPAEA